MRNFKLASGHFEAYASRIEETSKQRRKPNDAGVHGWFSDNKEWIEFIIATLLLWLLMMPYMSLI